MGVTHEIDHGHSLPMTLPANVMPSLTDGDRSRQSKLALIGLDILILRPALNRQGRPALAAMPSG